MITETNTEKLQAKYQKKHVELFQKSRINKQTVTCVTNLKTISKMYQ